MIFHYDDDSKGDWLFTLCSKGGNENDVTEGKRYTVLLGPNQSCRTAADNFSKLLSKKGDINLSDIESAFDVEALSKEFFGKYKSHYERFVEFITGKRFVKEDGKWSEKQIRPPHEHMYSDFGYSHKSVRDFVKKLMCGIVFFHFLHNQGWMGVPVSDVWG